MIRTLYLLTFQLTLTLVLIGASNAQDKTPPENWPEFRGPTGDGLAIGTEIPLKIDEQSRVKWKTKIHGKGWSSPVIWGEQVWLTTATPDGTRMSVICVDINSGEIVRDIVVHENKDPAFCHSTNSYASPTPAIEDSRVYLHFGSYGTTCLDTKTGKQIWQRKDLECDHFRGPASSPILHENMLIVAYDGFDQQYVVAFNKENGETIWKRNREIKYDKDNGDWKKAYCTGAIFDIDGKKLLVYPSASATIAYEVETGKPAWTVYHDGMNASARPIMTNNGLLVLTNGMGKMVAVDPKFEPGSEGSEDISKTNIKWRADKAIARKSSQLAIDKRVYMISDKGIASCLDQDTGEAVWQERIGGKFAASPIFDGEKIMVLSEDGTIHFFKPSDQFESLGKSKLGDGFMASPAFSGKRMILRSKSHLYCISK